MIIRDTSGQLFRVHDTKDYDHAWIGIAVKKVGDAYLPKARARHILVRKALATIVQAA